MRFPDGTPDKGYDVPILQLPERGPDIGCSKMFQCSKDSKKSQVCVGNDKWSPERDCHTSCDQSTGLCDSFKPSNGIDWLLHRGYGSLVIDKAFEINTDSCQPAGLPPGSFTVWPAEGCVLVVGELTIKAAGTLRAKGKRPLIIAASQAVTVEGTIDVSASGATPGPGGGGGGRSGSRPSGAGYDDGDGFGCGGGYAGDYGLFDGATGGAGGSFGNSGGRGGGRGGQGSFGPNARSSSTCPDGCSKDLIRSGSGGGAGAGGLFSAPGGGGGGGLQISSLLSIEILGTIKAGGGGGGAVAAWQSGSSGGGGGSGGGVILEAFKVSTGPDGLVAANGGGGGGGSPIGVDGNPGADAIKPSGGQAAGGQAKKSFLDVVWGGAGGAGSAGALPGADGGWVPEASVPVVHYAGGGGGGAGRICVRVSKQDLPASQAGRYSPVVDGGTVIQQLLP